MSVQFIQAAKLLNQADGSLFPDALHPGDVVAGVSHQGFDFNHLLGGYPVIFPDFFRGIGNLFLGFHQADGGGVADQLEAVPVPGGDDAAFPLFPCQTRQGTQQIVRFVAVQFQNRVTQSGEDVFQRLHLGK